MPHLALCISCTLTWLLNPAHRSCAPQTSGHSIAASNVLRDKPQICTLQNAPRPSKVKNIAKHNRLCFYSPFLHFLSGKSSCCLFTIRIFPFPSADPDWKLPLSPFRGVSLLSKPGPTEHRCCWSILRPSHQHGKPGPDQAHHFVAVGKAIRKGKSCQTKGSGRISRAAVRGSVILLCLQAAVGVLL